MPKGNQNTAAKMPDRESQRFSIVFQYSATIDAHRVNQSELGEHAIQIGDKSSLGDPGEAEIRLALQTVGLHNCRP